MKAAPVYADRQATHRPPRPGVTNRGCSRCRRACWRSFSKFTSARNATLEGWRASNGGMGLQVAVRSRCPGEAEKDDGGDGEGPAAHVADEAPRPVGIPRVPERPTAIAAAWRNSPVNERALFFPKLFGVRVGGVLQPQPGARPPTATTAVVHAATRSGDVDVGCCSPRGSGSAGNHRSGRRTQRLVTCCC